MSQKKEKYARALSLRQDAQDERLKALERRMDKASVCVARLNRRVTALSIKPDSFAACEDAVHKRIQQEDAEEFRQREARRTQRIRRNAKRDQLLALAAAILAIALALASVAQAKAVEPDPESVEESAPVVEIVQEQDDPREENENELIEAALLASAHRLDNVTVTHYCICQRCCGKAPDHPAYGITASGRRATPGVSVAVDPEVIPLGSDVLVDYGDGVIHYYAADDTGSGVTGRHIDLCAGSHEEALQMGRRTATVYWVAQEESV